MRSNDPRMRAALPSQVPVTGEIIKTELAPRIEPTAAWIAKMKAVKAAGGEVTEPADDEKELVVGIRCSYIIPSELVDQKDWPMVGMDIIEVGRVNMADLKGRVHEALAKAGNSMASRVVPQRSGAA